MTESQIKNNSSELSGEESVDLPINGRIAVYDNMRSIPRVIDFVHSTISSFIDEVPQKIYTLSHELGGIIPYTILKEIIENLIHADFKDIIITIMNNGNDIIISDQGPGIADKDRAFMPGYTSATSSMKKYIRGVGSGLPIVKETIMFSGGSVDVDSNIKKGTVVSLKIMEDKNRPAVTGYGAVSINNPGNTTQNLSKGFTGGKKNEPPSGPSAPLLEKRGVARSQEYQGIKLSIRQKKILSLMLELEESGPAKIAKELGFSLSTSYRELVFLEKLGFLTLTESGKRSLAPKGKKYLEYYSNSF